MFAVSISGSCRKKSCLRSFRPGKAKSVHYSWEKAMVRFRGYSGWSFQLLACRKDGQYAASNSPARQRW